MIHMKQNNYLSCFFRDLSLSILYRCKLKKVFENKKDKENYKAIIDRVNGLKWSAIVTYGAIPQTKVSTDKSKKVL